jgi:hypothetical protein
MAEQGLATAQPYLCHLGEGNLTNITSRACTGPLGRIPAGARANIIPVAEMPRRGFLAQLVKLPLIGGGLSLIGQPQAVAEPVTPGLLEAYRSWLVMEFSYLRAEMNLDGVRLGGFDPNNAGGMYHWRSFGSPPAPAPSTRAAVVLSAVGCDWKEQRHV